MNNSQFILRIIYVKTPMYNDIGIIEHGHEKAHFNVTTFNFLVPNLNNINSLHILLCLHPCHIFEENKSH